MPIVDDLATFEAERSQLHRFCDMRGRADLEVTAFLFEADEHLLEGCARLGVSRAPSSRRRTTGALSSRSSSGTRH
jgi:hypothetical protein